MAWGVVTIARKKIPVPLYYHHRPVFQVRVVHGVPFEKAHNLLSFHGKAFVALFLIVLQLSNWEV
jgi:hypothetical protein